MTTNWQGADLRENIVNAAQEAFAGMRAYHQSEIEHKRDAITILTTILAGNAGLIAAGFGVIEHAAQISYYVIWGVAGLVSFATLIAAQVIAGATIAKVNSDAERYQEFKAQSIKAKKLLGHYEPLTVGGETETIMAPPKPSKGAGKTKSIISAFAVVVIGFTLVGWLALAATWRFAHAPAARLPSATIVSP